MTIKRNIKIRILSSISCGIVCFILLTVITGFPQKYTWHSGKTNFSVFYSSIGTMVQGEINIKISENGEYERIQYIGSQNSSDRKIASKSTAKLTDGEMEDLFNYMINKNDFFKLSEDLSKSKNEVRDSSYDYLEVKFNDRTHRIGGYSASSVEAFTKAGKKFFEISDKYRGN